MLARVARSTGGIGAIARSVAIEATNVTASVRYAAVRPSEPISRPPSAGPKTLESWKLACDIAIAQPISARGTSRYTAALRAGWSIAAIEVATSAVA